MHKIRNFHEGHNTVGEWQGSGRETVWERHGMCESAFKVPSVWHSVIQRGIYFPVLRFCRVSPSPVQPAGLHTIPVLFGMAERNSAMNRSFPSRGRSVTTVRISYAP
jgi:hypothetical protein